MSADIICPWRIPRTFIQEHREYAFLYSTNVFRQSYFGQAFSAAGEPNSFGIPVRFRFCKSNASSYFSDDQFESSIKQIIDEAFALVPLDKPIIPLHGIGTGSSELNRRAPKTFAYIHKRISEIQYPNIKWNYYT